MRYWKGSIAFSTTQDYPLLRQVLHSGFITHSQLFEFMRLDYCASSRNAFNNRVLRLVKHGLLIRHELPFVNREAVYSVSEAGASEMAGKGECYATPHRPSQIRQRTRPSSPLSGVERNSSGSEAYRITGLLDAGDGDSITK